MADAIAAAPASQAGEGQNPPEVSAPKETVPPVVEPVKAGEEAKEEAKGIKTPEENKPEPFDKHPAWQRMLRRSTRMEAQNHELRTTLTEALSTLKELAAAQKGEEYKPEPVKKQEEVDFTSYLDNEIEELSSKESLSSEAEAKIVEIAVKYAYTVDGKK